jgi:hypothetical protein
VGVSGTCRRRGELHAPTPAPRRLAHQFVRPTPPLAYLIYALALSIRPRTPSPTNWPFSTNVASPSLRFRPSFSLSHTPAPADIPRLHPSATNSLTLFHQPTPLPCAHAQPTLSSVFLALGPKIGPRQCADACRPTAATPVRTIGGKSPTSRPSPKNSRPSSRNFPSHRRRRLSGNRLLRAI